MAVTVVVAAQAACAPGTEGRPAATTHPASAPPSASEPAGEKAPAPAAAGEDTVAKPERDESGPVADKPCRHEVDKDLDGEPEEIEHMVHDAGGRLVRVERRTPSTPGGGVKVTVLSYNDHGDLVRREHTPPDGEPRVAFTKRHTYGEDGRLARTETDRDADGTVDTVTELEYDDRGRKVVELVDSGADGTVERRRTFEYEGDRLVATDGAWDVRHIYEGDLRVRMEVDTDADGEPDGITRFEYDEHGRKTKEIFDLGADGEPEKEDIFGYDCADEDL